MRKAAILFVGLYFTEFDMESKNEIFSFRDICTTYIIRFFNN